MFLSKAFVDEKIELSNEEAEKVRKWFDKLKIGDKAQAVVKRILNKDNVTDNQKRVLISKLFRKKAGEIHGTDIETAVSEIQKILTFQFAFKEKEQQDEIFRCIESLILKAPHLDNTNSKGDIEKKGKGVI